jgi:hypothetical protein
MVDIDGITWKVWCSPTHGLGSWLTENAWMAGSPEAVLFCA